MSSEIWMAKFTRHQAVGRAFGGAIGLAMMLLLECVSGMQARAAQVRYGFSGEVSGQKVIASEGVSTPVSESLSGSFIFDDAVLPVVTGEDQTWIWYRTYVRQTITLGSQTWTSAESVDSACDIDVNPGSEHAEMAFSCHQYSGADALFVHLRWFDPVNIVWHVADSYPLGSFTPSIGTQTWLLYLAAVEQDGNVFTTLSGSARLDAVEPVSEPGATFLNAVGLLAMVVMRRRPPRRHAALLPSH